MGILLLFVLTAFFCFGIGYLVGYESNENSYYSMRRKQLDKEIHQLQKDLSKAKIKK